MFWTGQKVNRTPTYGRNVHQTKTHYLKEYDDTLSSLFYLLFLVSFYDKFIVILGQKGSKVQEARKPQKSESGPESSHSGADFDADKGAFGSTFFGPRISFLGRRF